MIEHLARNGLYIVCRTSAYDGKPCESAFRGLVPTVDTRNAASPELIPHYKDKSTDWWYKTGSNHRTVAGCILRDMVPTEVWLIECDSLLNFMLENGRIVMDTSDIHPGFCTIEIYDDYRE